MIGSKMRRRLVIDASVAQSAGDSEDEQSSACRYFLTHVFQICHRAVFTKELLTEWKNHESTFAKRWRLYMAEEGKFLEDETAHPVELGNQIKRLAGSSKKQSAMEKDAHLLAAAKAADSVVISLDETARRLFAELSRTVKDLRNVTWVNPNKQSEAPIRWLREGAKNEKSRQLSSFKKYG